MMATGVSVLVSASSSSMGDGMLGLNVWFAITIARRDRVLGEGESRMICVTPPPVVAPAAYGMVPALPSVCDGRATIATCSELSVWESRGRWALPLEPNELCEGAWLAS